MAQLDVLKVPFWGKWLALVVWLVFEAMIGYLAVSYNSQQLHYSAWIVFICGTSFTLLMVPGTCRILSTELSGDGVQQLAFFSNGHFWVTRKLSWPQVSSATFYPKRGTYKLDASSLSVLIALNLFPCTTAALQFVHEHLPKDVAVTMASKSDQRD
jgi:hypothetical protein